MPQLARIAAVQLLILAGGLVCIELTLHLVAPLPVHGGIYVDDKGDPVRVAKNDVLLNPNLRVTHLGSEFAARITTNAQGYRTSVNESTQPDYMFLGDSFTFGHGVPDDSVFANLFCSQQAASCMNLGRSGTNTFQQLKILRHALDNGMRPKHVVLVMLTACWIDSAGNDLGDNLLWYRSQVRASRGAVPHVTGAVAVRADMQGGAAAPSQAVFSVNDFMRTAQRRLGHFEIVRRTMLIIGSRLKSSVYACSEANKIAAALEATRAALIELQRIAAETPFDVAAFAIHPSQELAGAYRKTEAELAAIVPGTFAFFGTGARFRKDQYYPYDGHFNAAGHANMARILADELSRAK